MPKRNPPPLQLRQLAQLFVAQRVALAAVAVLELHKLVGVDQGLSPFPLEDVRIVCLLVVDGEDIDRFRLDLFFGDPQMRPRTNQTDKARTHRFAFDVELEASRKATHGQWQPEITTAVTVRIEVGVNLAAKLMHISALCQQTSA